MGVRATQLTVAHLLGLPLSHVRVLAPFVGGVVRDEGDGLAARDADRDGRARTSAGR